MYQLLRNFSLHDQKLYSLILQVCAVALILGLLIGLISFNGNKKDGNDNWQPTTLIPSPDMTAEFSTVTNKPRWFREKGGASRAEIEEQARKAIEGQPESLKLIGIVERSGHLFALFLPVSGSGSKSVKQFSVGDTLVGDWKVKDISTARVLVESNKEGNGIQTKEILLYSSKK